MNKIKNIMIVLHVLDVNANLLKIIKRLNIMIILQVNLFQHCAVSVI